jgi:hypothetical protein
VVLDDPPAAPDLPVRLEKLRLKSGVSAVLLFGSNQEMLGAAGSLPVELDLAAFIPLLGGVLSASARLSTHLGKSLPDNLLVFRGTQFDLYLAPIGSGGYLAAIKSGLESQYPVAVLRKISRAAVGLAPFVPDGSTTPPSIGRDSQEDGDGGRQVEEAEELTQLFHQAGELSTDTQALDIFWAQAVLEEEAGSPREADRLSYGQARDLGLAPDD